MLITKKSPLPLSVLERAKGELLAVPPLIQPGNAGSLGPVTGPGRRELLGSQCCGCSPLLSRRGPPSSVCSLSSEATFHHALPGPPFSRWAALSARFLRCTPLPRHFLLVSISLNHYIWDWRVCQVVFVGMAKTAIRHGHSPQLLPQHLHQAFMPLLRIVLVISNSHSQDASRIFRLLSKLSFQPKGILTLLNLPDGFRRCMINL